MASALFYKAADFKEACVLLSKHDNKATILAGGTDLMSRINRKMLSPEIVISISSSGLNYIKAERDSLIIGATSTHSEIVRSRLLQKKTPLLVEATKQIGSVAIRNMGTIGGNLVNASPAADTATALLALGARLKLTSTSGDRDVAIEEFFTGPGKTVLGQNELLQEVIIPSQNTGSRWAWHKLGTRKADICSVVSVAIVLQMDGNICSWARIALGAVAPTPLIAKQAGNLLKGKPLDTSIIRTAAKAASEEIAPIDDVRATAWYRRRVSETLVRRLLSQILE